MATKQEKLNAIVKDLAGDFVSTVKEIEKEKYPTTRNHYGRYMNIISQLAKGSRQMGEVIALALVEAGANKQGVRDALRVSF
jgi:hypothetical protein